MSASYPVMLNLQGHRCVIIGGGRVAAHKAAGLLEAGAWVTVISPEICTGLEALGGQIDLIPAHYTPGLLSDLHPLLVFTATDDPAINQEAAEEARACGALVNRVDAAGEGDFENMVSFQRGRITAALSTGGASPALARHLSEHLQTSIGDEYAKLADWMAEARPQVRAAISAQSRRSSLWRAIIQSPILEELRRGNLDEARRLFDRCITQAIGETL